MKSQKPKSCCLLIRVREWWFFAPLPWLCPLILSQILLLENLNLAYTTNYCIQSKEYREKMPDLLNLVAEFEFPWLKGRESFKIALCKG